MIYITLKPSKCIWPYCFYRELTRLYLYFQLYKHDDPECSELCECNLGEVLSCKVLECIEMEHSEIYLIYITLKNFIQTWFDPIVLLWIDKTYLYLVSCTNMMIQYVLNFVNILDLYYLGKMWPYLIYITLEKLPLRKCLAPLFLSWIDKTYPLFSVVQTRWSRMFWTLWMQSGWSFVMQGSWMHWKGCLQHRSGLLQPCFAILSSLPWPMSVLLGLICLLKTP